MNKRVTVHLIAAARPNFMKVAPLYHALKSEAWCDPILVHTGQHYDPDMSDAFFADLSLPRPDFSLGVGSGSHAEQTAGVMVAYEKVCLAHRPDWVVVVGDVNSTMACAITAKKLCVPVAHLEAGLRSRDRTMPEEINRLATDAISDLLWTPSPDADENLRNEGVPEERVVRVGNIMIDSFEMLRERIEKDGTGRRMGLEGRPYGVVTLHRPVNVDSRERLTELTAVLEEVGRELTLVFPVHPRTRGRLEAFGLWQGKVEGIHLANPLGYVSFMNLVHQATLVITDSGGVQEETTYLGIPCLTLRESTERPITVTEGSNRLIKVADLKKSVAAVLAGAWPRGKRPERWDGKTALRIANSLKKASNA
jgi:UDP-N-acetylglucosamine 2-epimerase (non-hydrolysing)